MLEVRRCGSALGAEVSGVDLSQEVDAQTFGRIVDLLHEHEVIFFRGQNLTPEQHIAFSRRFGELEHHVRQECCRPGYPEIFVVSQDAGLFWHSDLCYKQQPSRASLFYAREVPRNGDRPAGDTMFASTTAAYEALTEPVKQQLQGRRAINSYAKGYYRDRKSGPRPPLTEEQKRKTPDMAHPAVRTHPYNGRKCLFVNEGYTARIEGMEESESDALLEALFAHIRQPQFVYRHQWQVGDFLIWDNCATQHCAVQDYALPQRRLMERTTLCGSTPF
jgi:taurine dioxygenase